MKSEKWLTKVTLVVMLTLGLSLFSVSSEATIYIPLDYTFTGVSASAGPAGPYWLGVEIGNTNDAVSLTLTSNLDSSSGAFISNVYLNLDPSLFNLDPDLSQPLNFAQNGGSPTAYISQGENAFKADGDGYFDILFSFPTSGAGERFDGQDSITFTVSALGANFSEDSFYYLSAPGGGRGSYHAAAHVQGLGGSSSWIGDAPMAPVPEPGTLLLLGSSLVGMAGVGAFRSRM